MTDLFVLRQRTTLPQARLSRIDLTPSRFPERHLTGGWWQVPAKGAPRPLHRAAGRAARRQQQLLAYLWHGDVPVSDVVCERDLRPGHEAITAYSALRLHQAAHHVFVGGSPPAGPRVDDLVELTIVAGGCLFSARAARLVTGSGRIVPVVSLRRDQVGEQVVDLLLDDELTLSEADTAARLPAVGAGVLAGIPPRVPVRVVMDVPRAATMLTLLRGTQQGEVSAKLLLRWCDAVAARHARLVELHAGRWRAALGSAAAVRPVRLEVSAELESVGVYLRGALSRGRVPAIEELVERAAAQDRLWRLLVRVARPATPIELADLSYVAAQLRAAASTPQDPRLVVAVENVYEAKIQQRSGALAHALQAELPGTRFPLVGIYPLGRVWVRDVYGNIRLNLHTHDPGRWAIDEDGRAVDLYRLATGLYAATAPDGPLVAHH